MPLMCIDLVKAQVQPESPRETGGKYVLHIKSKAMCEFMPGTVSIVNARILHTIYVRILQYM